MITQKVTSSTSAMLLSPAMLTSAVIGAGPVTCTRTPGGGGELATMSRTAATASLDSASPMLPARFSVAYAARPSELCAAASVSGSPQVS